MQLIYLHPKGLNCVFGNGIRKENMKRKISSGSKNKKQNTQIYNDLSSTLTF